MKRISIIAIMLFVEFSCKNNEKADLVIEIPVGTLELIHSYTVNVPEPSGL